VLLEHINVFGGYFYYIEFELYFTNKFFHQNLRLIFLLIFVISCDYVHMVMKLYDYFIMNENHQIYFDGLFNAPYYNK